MEKVNNQREQVIKDGMKELIEFGENQTLQEQQSKEIEDLKLQLIEQRELTQKREEELLQQIEELKRTPAQPKEEEILFQKELFFRPKKKEEDVILVKVPRRIVNKLKLLVLGINPKNTYSRYINTLLEEHLEKYYDELKEHFNI